MAEGKDLPDREEPVFDRDFAGAAGEAVALTPLVRRILAQNPGPFTWRGTNSYVVGRGTVAVIDPGPDDAVHIARLLDALRGETVSHILVTHTHRDHSPGARALAEKTGASVLGCAPYAPRLADSGETPRLDASHDGAHAPAHILGDGETVSGPGWTLAAVATPGHASNHLCFALAEENALFSGDHVMAWSTSVVAPPDGDMAGYMTSLQKLRAREDAIYWPGHGGPVKEPQRFARGLVNHRRQREAAILARLAAGDRRISQIVPILYSGVARELHPAAGMSVLAHLIDLVARGAVETDSTPDIEADYRLAA